MRKEKEKIRVSKKLKKELSKYKKDRETYEDVIWRIPNIPDWDIKPEGIK